jgi:phospholipase D1/2
MPANQSPILIEGRNCWRVAQADRFALIVDAGDYFRAAKEAILRARHSVYLVGWDFDTRIKFEPERTLEGPNKLGPFLRWIDKNRPEIQVHILKWDLGALFTLGRGTTPLAVLNWRTSNRIHFKLDGAHPPGAAQHHKIVVVDDVLAFCGGIDMTSDRWDTPRHLDDDRRRTRPNGKLYGPWHDATAAVDGDAARALGELARIRWKKATGDELKPPPELPPIWPQGLPSTFENARVGIARTIPQYDGQAPAHEIEALYLDAIKGARHSIYIESQYFAARKLGEAIAARLQEEDGPEIVVINPESADGYLESATMDSARARLLKLVHEADRYKRFRIFTPVTAGRDPIYVHAKILVIDDRLLRVGSSNLNNRSMGFDTECDLVVDAYAEESAADDLRRKIEAVRNGLLAEHLATDPETIKVAMSAHDGSLTAAIDSLIVNNGRSLVPYVPREPNVVEKQLAENDLFDPERPPKLWRRTLATFGLASRPFR